MGYNIGWIIPRLRSPSRLWYCASSITLAVVGLFSKIVIEFLNKTTVYNREALQRAVCRPPGVPLLTVSNHHSCFDDPGLWGVLDCVTLVRGSRMRWSLAAHDICFTNALHSCFFALGKCVPVVRGAGVYQPAMDFCVERLSAGEWVHIFPEGRVNVAKEHIRFKWGVGRLVAGSRAPPLVVPVWHEGLDRVLPNREPYLLKFRKRVFLNVGEPIQLDRLLDRLRKSNASEEETRKAITDRIQEELIHLRERTHALIKRAVGDHADGLLDHRTDVLGPVGNGPKGDHGHATENGPTTDHGRTMDNGPIVDHDRAMDNGPIVDHDRTTDKGPIVDHTTDNGPIVDHDGTTDNGPTAAHGRTTGNGPTVEHNRTTDHGSSADHATFPNGRAKDKDL